MARRGQEAMAKRARERARLEKQEAKREKREARANETDDQTKAEATDLMEEFARLSERFEAGTVTQAEYDTQRTRIFEELGIEPA